MVLRIRSVSSLSPEAELDTNCGAVELVVTILRVARTTCSFLPFYDSLKFIIGVEPDPFFHQSDTNQSHDSASYQLGTSIFDFSNSLIIT